jgi:hypothetical protein
VPIDHFDDEAAARLDHERSEVPIGDDVADERLVEVGADLGEVDLPKAPRPIQHGIGAPDAVDEHIETPRVVSDTGGEARHLLLARMVYSHGDGATTGLLDQNDRLVDGLRTIHTF